MTRVAAINSAQPLSLRGPQRADDPAPAVSLRPDWQRDDWSRWTQPPDLTKQEYREAAELTAELVAVAALRRSARDDADPVRERFPTKRGAPDANLAHPLAG